MALYYYPQIETVVIDADGDRVPVGGVTVEFYNITQDVSITSIVSDSQGIIDPGSLNSATEPVNLLDTVELRHGTYDATVRLVLQATPEDAAGAVENNVATYVLQDNYGTVPPDSAAVFVQDMAFPEVAPVFIGTIRASGQSSIPFDGVVGKTYDVITAPRHKDWDFHAANREQLSHQILVIGEPGATDFPPSFSAVAYDSVNSEVDLTFAKVGSATGDIKVEYKLTTDSNWTLHGTDFAHGATSGSVSITEQPTALTYDIRLSQDGVAGYSTVRQVTVDASAGGTPPSDLGAEAGLINSPPDEYQIDLAWTAGSGSGDYTVERKINNGSWSVLTTSESSTNFAEVSVFAVNTGKTYYYRVKQNDVTGYSNTAQVYIPRNTG